MTSYRYPSIEDLIRQMYMAGQPKAEKPGPPKIKQQNMRPKDVTAEQWRKKKDQGKKKVRDRWHRKDQEKKAKEKKLEDAYLKSHDDYLQDPSAKNKKAWQKLHDERKKRRGMMIR